MTDIICPLCGKPNPPDRDECQFCQAPLKASGFLAPTEGSDQPGQFFGSLGTPSAADSTPPPEPNSSLEDAIPDWLKNMEAGFASGAEAEPENEEPLKIEPVETGHDTISDQIDSLLNTASEPESPQIPAADDEWLTSLLAGAGAGTPASGEAEETPESEQPEEIEEQESEPPEEALPAGQELPPAEPAEPSTRPDWLTSLEAASPFKLEGGIIPQEPAPAQPSEPAEEEPQEAEQVIPPWVTSTAPDEQPAAPPPAEPAEEGEIARAELPSWLEALKPPETVAPSGPVEDVSASEVVTAGPLVGLRGVISAHPSAVRARKPPTYSIKLRVTDEQRMRVEMMEELLAEEGKSKPVAAQPLISSRHIFRLLIALLLLLPIAWMIITGSQRVPPPQPADIPGVTDFVQQMQKVTVGAPVLLAFDYEPGFSGELNTAVTNVVTQLMLKNAFITLASTVPSGPALGESVLRQASTVLGGKAGSYASYTDLGYIPGGTTGLLGLANSPRSTLPYSLDEIKVWEAAPLSSVSTIADFSAVIVVTSDPDTARLWIEQVGPKLKVAGTPLLFITSTQAEPLIRPYYEANPPQVQGLVSGMEGGVVYGRVIGHFQGNGTWDALSLGMTVSVLVILVGSVVSAGFKMLPGGGKKEG